jgi:hypothetical protein
MHRPRMIKAFLLCVAAAIAGCSGPAAGTVTVMNLSPSPVAELTLIGPREGNRLGVLEPSSSVSNVSALDGPITGITFLVNGTRYESRVESDLEGARECRVKFVVEPDFQVSTTVNRKDCNR